MLSLETRIKNYLENWFKIDPEHWENGGNLERLALSIGFKASNASRRLRELCEEGYIENRYNNKHHVEYRWKSLDKTQKSDIVEEQKQLTINLIT